MKLERECVNNLARFTGRIVSLVRKAVFGEPAPAFDPGVNGYADRVTVAVHGLREYLGYSYRQLLDVLDEMPGIVSKLDLKVAELPDFTTVSTRIKNLEMSLWRVLIQLTADQRELGDVQGIDKTGFDRCVASRRLAVRTNDTFKAVNTTVFSDFASRILDISWKTIRQYNTLNGERVLTTKSRSDRNYHRTQGL